MEELENIAKEKHTFAICAYKKSEYLEEAIKSVVNQKIKSNYLLVTSTPSEYIENLAKKYNIKYYVRNGKSDIQDDWNFACSKVNTELVTIVHQDDIYHEDYLLNIISNYDSDATLYYTDYHPYKNGKITEDINAKIKRKLKAILKIKLFSRIYYRIHDEATTKEFIVTNKRQQDDIAVFNKIWPNFITKIIMKFYVKCYDTYSEEK